MKKIINFLRYLSQSYHYFFHFLFGGASALIVNVIARPQNTSFLFLLFIALLASALPDIDHFLFAYFYGSSSQYAKMFRHYLRRGEIGRWARFCLLNHNKNYGLYFHNILTMLVAFILVLVFIKVENLSWVVFWLAFALHFAYDILDDVLLFGRPNPNWFLSFQSEPQNLEEA